MKKMMNMVIKIKYEEKLFSPEIMDIVNCWHVEFNEDGIVAYERKYGSRKRENVRKVEVPVEEMKSFFSDIYKFFT